MVYVYVPEHINEQLLWEVLKSEKAVFFYMWGPLVF